MTHRRLFLWLFSVSTALLLAPFIHSMFYQTGMTLFTPGRMFDLSLRLGTLRVEVQSEATRITHSYQMITWYNRIPVELRREFGSWSWGSRGGSKVTYPPGSYSGHHRLHSTPPTASTPLAIRHFSFPLLQPWLLCAGASFLMCRPLARRSVPGKDKALEEQSLSAGDAGEPA